MFSVSSLGTKVTQQTLTLTFNSSGVLTNIDNKPALTSQ
jgi:outer membrane protein assembly factor BamE